MKCQLRIRKFFGKKAIKINDTWIHVGWRILPVICICTLTWKWFHWIDYIAICIMLLTLCGCFGTNFQSNVMPENHNKTKAGSQYPMPSLKNISK